MADAERISVPSDYLYDQVIRTAAAVCSLDPDTGWLVCERDPADEYLVSRVRKQLLQDGATCKEVDDAMNEAYDQLRKEYTQIHKLTVEDFNG